MSQYTMSFISRARSYLMLETAKKPETRAKRMVAILAQLKAGEVFPLVLLQI